MTARHGTIRGADGRDIAVTVDGAGPQDLMLIHGWACHRGFWHHQIGPLSRDARVITLDLPGHGASPAADQDQAVSIAGLAQAVVSVAEALSLSDVILVGHSMGGPVAVEAAIRLAGRCQLVLGVDTFTDPAFYTRRARHEIAARRRPFEADFSAAMGAMIRRITLAGEPTLPAWITTEMSRPDPAAALAVFDALLSWDSEARWPALPCPVETINSAQLHSTMNPPHLAGLRVHLMDRVGHFPMLEAPLAFTKLAQKIIAERNTGCHIRMGDPQSSPTGTSHKRKFIDAPAIEH